MGTAGRTLSMCVSLVQGDGAAASLHLTVVAGVTLAVHSTPADEDQHADDDDRHEHADYDQDLAKQAVLGYRTGAASHRAGSWGKRALKRSG